ADVLDKHGPCAGTVTLPQFVVTQAEVAGTEEERAVDICQVRRVRAVKSEAYVLDEHGACTCSVALPQLGSGAAVVGHKKQGAVYVRRALDPGVPRGVDDPDQVGHQAHRRQQGPVLELRDRRRDGARPGQAPWRQEAAKGRPEGATWTAAKSD